MIESTGRRDVRRFSQWGVKVVSAWTDDPQGHVVVFDGDVHFEAPAGAIIYVHVI
jgi:hypothetical protein